MSIQKSRHINIHILSCFNDEEKYIYIFFLKGDEEKYHK